MNEIIYAPNLTTVPDRPTVVEQWQDYLRIIPRVRMGSESIAHEGEREE